MTDLGIYPDTASDRVADSTEPLAVWAPVGLAEAETAEEEADPYDGELDDDSEAI